ncbi:MAG: hypothetical protein RR807_02950, partial [Oscillospiraceae bacterium]
MASVEVKNAGASDFSHLPPHLYPQNGHNQVFPIKCRQSIRRTQHRARATLHRQGDGSLNGAFDDSYLRNYVPQAVIADHVFKNIIWSIANSLIFTIYICDTIAFVMKTHTISNT